MISKRLMIGLLTISLSACASTRTPSAQPTSGNAVILMEQWDAASASHPNEPAPPWAKKQYAEPVKTVVRLEAEIKELKISR